MIFRTATLLLFTMLAGAFAEEVVPGSLQGKQAQKFVEALDAAPTECSQALAESENSFLCATTSRGVAAFRATIDVQANNLTPTGPWTAYTDEEGQQRSFLYKDGFMTVTYFPPDGTSGDSLMVVHYVIPHD